MFELFPYKYVCVMHVSKKITTKQDIHKQSCILEEKEGAMILFPLEI